MAGDRCQRGRKIPTPAPFLHAVYLGDAAYQGSTSAVLNQVVLETTSRATLTSSPNPSMQGQAVTFTAKISSPTVMPTGTGYVHGGEDSSGNRSTQSRQGDTHDLVAARGLDQSHGYLLRKLQHREEFGFGDSERAVNAGLGVSADCAEEGCSDARGREWAKVKATNTICARNPIICEASTRTTMLVRCFTVRTVLISELPMSNSENGCSKYRQPSWNSKLD